MGEHMPKRVFEARKRGDVKALSEMGRHGALARAEQLAANQKAAREAQEALEAAQAQETLDREAAFKEIEAEQRTADEATRIQEAREDIIPLDTYE